MLQFLTEIENMLALCERRIHIGINQHAGEAQRHGVLWVNADLENGKRVSLRAPIIIDKPQLVRDGLNYATWRRVKRQIEKMGINATHIELKFDGKHYCYRLDMYKELYATSGGTPLHYKQASV